MNEASPSAPQALLRAIDKPDAPVPPNPIVVTWAKMKARKAVILATNY
jgi:hypothetical protein